MKNITAAFLMLLPLSASAGTTISNKSVGDILINLDTGIYFRTIEPISDPEECGNGYYKLQESEYINSAISVLITAQTAGKNINYKIGGCDAGYPVVKIVTLRAN